MCGLANRVHAPTDNVAECGVLRLHSEVTVILR